MKLVSIFRKSVLQQIRDPWTLVLSLCIGPFFVLLYWLFFPSGSTAYDIAIINRDNPVTVTINGSNEEIQGGKALTQALEEITYHSGDKVLNVNVLETREKALKQLRDRDIDVLIEVPEDFSASLADIIAGKREKTGLVEFSGDVTNPYYLIGAVFSSVGLEETVTAYTGQISPMAFNETFIGDSGARSEFELYIPGLLIFALIILVFQTAMLVTREVEGNTLLRLRLAGVSTFELLGGMSLSVILFGFISLLLTFFTALVLGFESAGSLVLVLVVCLLACFSIIATSLIIAAFAKNVNQAFIMSNFPLMLFMFFSGAAYPVPKVVLFSIGGQSIGAYDILPPTHAVTALNKIMTLGMGAGDIIYELVSLVVLTVLFFIMGTVLFKRRHM